MNQLVEALRSDPEVIIITETRDIEVMKEIIASAKNSKSGLCSFMCNETVTVNKLV